MDGASDDRSGNAPDTHGPAGPPPGQGDSPAAGRSSRRLVVVLVLVLSGLIALSLIGLLATGGFSLNAPGSELEGQWSGTGTVADCDGIACAPLEIDLAIDCSWTSCTVPVFGEHREIKEAGDRFRAIGSIPPQHTPRCASSGVLASGTWELELGLEEGALVGRYTERSLAPNCGGLGVTQTTAASWDFALERA